ncbi:YopX family protein [Clostridium rectalis]|uniref:YopX family protein n=1 Tax=Clostridium rectalis TaxID=2040295 RepID=UPI000F62F40A|nr:YopX family protein [Clostridium rectalis]
MREIKFRAWNECEKIMECNIQDEYDGDLCCFGCYLNNEFWKVMQYTGLKDKKGVDIYEGDILTFAFEELDGTKKKGFLIIDDITDYETMNILNIANFTEIIGNIYENLQINF